MPHAHGPLDRRHIDVLARGWHVLDPELARGLPATGPGASPGALLAGALDEPVVLTRDADGVECLLSNACTHRGALVCAEPGARDGLRCAYHGRRFGLDGTCRHRPGFAGPPTAADALPRAPFGRLGPIRLASVTPEVSLEETLAPIRARIAWLPLDRLRPVPALDRDYAVEASWTLYVENYLEGLHIPFVHPGLSGALDLPDYRTELLPCGSVQVGVAADGERAFDPPTGHPEAGRRVAAWYFHLAPATMINVYPWGVSMNAVQPLGPGHTRVRFTTWTWEPEGSAASADLPAHIAGVHQTELEDEGVVALVQRGVGARLWRGGALHPTHEAAVADFRARLGC